MLQPRPPKPPPPRPPKPHRLHPLQGGHADVWLRLRRQVGQNKGVLFCVILPPEG